MAKQKNATVTAAGKKAASTAPAKHQFIGTKNAKVTSGPSVMNNPNIGPAGAPYSVKSPYTNKGR